MPKMKYFDETSEQWIELDSKNADAIKDENGTVTASDFLSHQADYLHHVPYGVATGTKNVYAVTLNPAPTAYAEGMAVSVKINVASDAASTINVNGLGAKGIKKSNGTDVTNLKANGIYTLRYDGTDFILQGEGGEYGTAQAGDVRSTKTFGTENGVVQGALDLSLLVPENIRNGLTIDGISGTLEPKKLATGSTANYSPRSGVKTISGIAFRPLIIFIYTKETSASNRYDLITIVDTPYQGEYLNSVPAVAKMIGTQISNGTYTRNRMLSESDSAEFSITNDGCIFYPDGTEGVRYWVALG